VENFKGILRARIDRLVERQKASRTVGSDCKVQSDCFSSTGTNVINESKRGTSPALLEELIDGSCVELA
jgi:hypothetical protein